MECIHFKQRVFLMISGYMYVMFTVDIVHHHYYHANKLVCMIINMLINYLVIFVNQLLTYVVCMLVRWSSEMDVK